MTKVLVVLVLTISSFASAQYENYTWVVGAKDVINFDVQTKEPINAARPGNPDYTLEGVAIANNPENGRVMFYHDGHQVFNRNFVPMIGGTDIGSKIQGSTGQGAAIYTIPDCTNKKFIAFSNDADHSVFPFKKGKLYYSVVDMTSGDGQVTTSKVQMRNDLDEGMIVINDYENGKSWLVAKLMDQNKIVSIPLSADLSSLTDQSQHIISSFGNTNDVISSIYTLRYNPILGKIAMSGFFPAATVATVDFNMTTGLISNLDYVDRSALNNKGNTQESYIIDVCWSPDGSKLYAITQKHMSLYQYDYNAGKQRTLIIQDPQSVDNGGMKVGPDGKIWVINNTLPVDPTNPIGSFNISRIHNPNRAGGACNLILNDHTLLSNGYFYFPVHTEFDYTDKEVKIINQGENDLCSGQVKTIGVNNGNSWTWNTGDNTSTIDVSESGEYFADVQLSNGCIVRSDTVSISFTEVPVVNAGDDLSVSCGTKVELKATASVGANVSWIGFQNSNETLMNVGQGTFIAKAVSQNGICSSTDTVMVIEEANNVSMSLVGDELVCQGTGFSILAAVNGVNGTPIYSWNDGSTNDRIVVEEAQASSVWSLTVTDTATSCSVTNSFEVVVQDLEVDMVASGQLEFCEGESIQLDAFPKDYDELIWNDGLQASDNRIVEKSGTYSFIMKKGVCERSSDNIVIEVKEAPIADFYFDSINLKADQEITFYNNSVGGDVYNWTMGNGENISSNSSTTSYSNPGAYYVSLEAVSDFGCSNEYGRIVTIVEEKEETTVFIPNTFTPGNDNLNSRLNVVGVQIKSVQMLIYDRWGTIQFYSPNQLVGWDGNDLEGNPLDAGVYAVQVQVETTKGDIIDKRQSVLLYRH